MADNSSDNHPSHGAAKGSGSTSRAGSGRAHAEQPAPAAPTVEPTVKTKRDRYLVASRPLPGIQPMAVDIIASSLSDRPDVTIVKRVRPSGFGAFSASGASGSGMPEIVVAEMDQATGATLQASAPPHVIVERDALLRHADDITVAFNSAMTLSPGVGIDVKLRVIGTGGQPLAKATIYVYGLGFPGQGITDNRGEATVTVFGGPLETIQAIYVKPAADYWERLFDRPALSDGVNTLQLQPFAATFQNFPQAALLGWGQRMMKLDQIDPSMAGQGVKIGIVDSGCDNTHPQLTHVTRGMDFTNNRDTASWVKDTMSHGTHCAGVITGASGQVKGVRGFAPMAEVHSLKVFPGGRFSDLIDALDQCIQRQVDVVNLSLGSSEVSELVAHKLVEVRQNGIACIVAAGNASGPVQFPGTEPTVLCVSAMGKLGEFPDDSYHARTVVPGLVAGQMFSPKFTCFGPQVAVAGPGVAIVSTVPGGGYAAWDGTSMATPHVTGMAALLLAHHPVFRDGARLRNEQRVAQLFSLLAGTCTPFLGDRTREGAGLPDLQKAAGLVASANAPGVAVANAGPMGGLSPFSANIPFAVPNINPALLPPFGGTFLPPGINPALLQGLLQMRSAGLI